MAARKSQIMGRFVLSAVITAIFFVCGVRHPAQQAPAPWVVGEVRIVGAGIVVSPATQPVPLNVATVVNTLFGDGSSPAPPTWVVRGVLSGPEGPPGTPQFFDNQVITAVPNSPFQIPPIPIAGRYYLSDIVLKDGDTVLAQASPGRVQIDVANILVTGVTSRPMTMDEIQQSGIVLNTNDYKAYRYTVGLGLQSGNINLDFPILFSATDPTRPPIVLNRLQLPGPPPLPGVLPQQTASQRPECLKCLQIEPVKFEMPDLDIDIPGLNLTGLLVFPSSITFLNQFFAVGVILQNGAPVGSSLELDQMSATFHLPGGVSYTVKQTKPEADGGVVPVVWVGTDGQLDPAVDTVRLLLPGMQGQSEFDVEIADPGTYAVTIDFSGTLKGLPSGKDTPITGRATSVVIVRDPTFNVTFSHPAVVRQGDVYALKVTLTNTSEVAANDVSIGLPANQISGAQLISGSGLVALGTLAAGDSKTTEFTLMALKTGMVTATSMSGGGGTTGSIILTTGVGEAGVPLSPNTLILPEIVTESLPADVVDGSLELLGLGWSLATAPPESRPDGLATVSEGDVQKKADLMTALARYMKLGGPANYTLQGAMAELALGLLGNSEKNEPFDALRRLPPYMVVDTPVQSKGMKVAEAIGSHLAAPGQGVLEAHAAFAAATSVLNPHFSVAVDPSGSAQPPKVWIEDQNGKKLGDSDATGGISRDIPWGESFHLAAGRLFAIGRIEEGASYQFNMEGQGDGSVDLSFYAPLSGGMTLVRFLDVPVSAVSKARMVFDLASAQLLLENDLAGNGGWSQISPASAEVIPLPALKVLGAAQDLMADRTGRAVSVVFNRPVDKTQAENLSNYGLDTRELTGAFFQADGRTVELRAASRLSPLVQNRLTIQGDLAGASQGPVTVAAYLDSPAGTVRGTVYGEDGMPLPGAAVDLFETEPDTLGGGMIPHITAQTTTGAGGEFFFDYVSFNRKSFRLEALDPATGHVAKLNAVIGYSGHDLRVSLFLRARGSLNGRVFGADGVTPASGALVTASEISTGEFGQAYTDFDGNYRIDRLPVGTLSILAEHGYSGGAHARATARLERAGDVVTADLFLSDTPTGSVTGRVLAGDPPAPVQAAAVALDGVTSVLTGEDGRFVISGILPGAVPYALRVFEPVTFAPAITRYVAVTGGTTTDTGDLIIPPPGAAGEGTISGHLYDSHGAGVAGAVVYAAIGQGVAAQSVTLAGGAFSLEQLPLGTYTVTAYDPVSRKSASGSATIMFDGQSIGLSLYFPSAGSVTGTVYRYGETGVREPARSTRVILGSRETFADLSGRFAFSDVPLGSHEVKAVSPSNDPTDIGFGGARLDFEGQSANAEIQMLGRGSLRVHVQIPSGDTFVPVAALVNVKTQKINPESFDLDSEIRSAYSDATGGIATFDGLLGTGVSITATNGFNASGSASATVVAGQTADVTITLLSTGGVTGIAYAEDGVTKLPRALVTLSVGGMPDRSVATVASGPDLGKYEFDLVTPGSVKVTAKDPITGRTGTAIGLVSGGRTLNLDITLLGNGSVRGTVLEDDGTGNLAPAPNAAVTLNGPSLSFPRTTSSDLSGQFIFDDIQEGPYSIEALDANRQFPIAGRAQANVIKNQTAEVSVVLGSFGTVTGSLLMADGATPVPNAQITMNLFASFPMTGFAATDQLGRFLFEYVPIGSPFTLEAFDQRSGRGDTGQGELTQPNQLLDITLTLSAVGAIFGRVTENDGVTPVPNPVMTASLPAGGGTVMAEGDAYGEYEMPGMPEGTYTVTAMDPRNRSAAAGTGTIAGEGGRAEVNISMQPFGGVTGHVYRSDGTTVVHGAIVSLDKLYTGAAAQVVAADEYGQFSFNGVKMGAHTLTAEDPLSRDGGKATFSLETDGQSASADIIFIGLGTVRGTVSGSGSVEGFTVALTSKNAFNGTETAYFTGTPASGAFEFLNQRAGQITLTASAPQGSGDTRKGIASGALEAGGELALNISLTPAGTVMGHVVNESGAAVSGATVQLVQSDPSGVFFTGTDSSGFFRFPVIPVGEFLINVAGPNGTGRAHASGELEADGQVLTLQPITLDTIPPAVVGSTPANGETDVARAAELAVTYSEPVDLASITASTVALKNAAGQAVAAVRSLSQDGLTLTVTPSAPLEGQSTYTLALSRNIMDLNGNGMAGDITITFTTLDDIPPSVTLVFPSDGAVELPPETVPFLIFSEAISLEGGALIIQSGGNPVSGTVALTDEGGSPRKLIFIPDFALAANSLYTVTVSGYMDLAATPNQMAPFTSTFSTIDTEPPVITISGVTEGGLYGQSVTPQIAVTDLRLNPASVAVTLDGQPYASGTTLSQDKDYILEVSAADMGGRISQVAAHFAIDKLAPAITISGVADGVAYPQAVTPQITITDPHLDAASVSITLDGQPYTGGTPVGQEAEHILLVSASDTLGHQAQVTLHFSVDTTPPSVTLTLPSGAVLPNHPVNIQAAAQDNLGIARVEFFVEGVLKFTDSTSPYSYSYTTPLEDGTLAITATAFDRAGNQATDSKPLVVSSDTTPPTVSLYSPAAGAEFMNGSNISMAASASDDTAVAGVEFKLQDDQGVVSWSSTDTSYPYQASFPVSGLTENLDRYIVARAYDAFGNETVTAPRLVHLVYNHMPTATLVSPTQSSLAISGGTLQIQAIGSDQDGQVLLTELLVGAVPAKTCQAAQCSTDYSVSEAAGSQITVSARVTGDKGETADSPTVTLTVIADPGTTVHGQVADVQGAGVEGAQVSVAGTALIATTSAGGVFDIPGAPTINGPLTLNVTYTLNGIPYSGAKAGITPLPNSTTQAGTITLSGLNDQLAIKATVGLEGSAIRVERWGAKYTIAATTSATASQNHIYIVDVNKPNEAALVPGAMWTATGTIHDMEVHGNLVIVGDNGLSILEITDNGEDPPALVQKSALASAAFSGMSATYPNAVTSVNGLAYVGNYSNIYVVDISNPGSPVILRSVATSSSELKDLAVWKNRLLAASGNTSYPVVNGSLDDPKTPAFVINDYPAGFGDGYGADRLLVSGDTLYVARDGKGLATYHLSAAGKPTLIKSSPFPGTAGGMRASGSTLYLADGAPVGLVTIINADTANPVMSAQVNTPDPGTCADVAITGACFVVADGTVGIRTILQSRTAPVVDTSMIRITAGSPNAQIHGDAGCVFSANYSLSLTFLNTRTFDVATKTLSESGQYFDVEIPASPGDEITLTVQDGATPPLTTTVSLGTVPAGAAVSFAPIVGTSATDSRQVVFAGNYLLVNATDRVVLLDPADIAAPDPSYRIASGTIHDIAVSGDLVLVGDDGLTIMRIDASVSPPALVWVSSLPASSFSGMGTYYTNKVAAYGQTAYVAYDGLLWPVDISVPSAPRVLGSVHNGGYVVTDLVVWRNELLASTTHTSYPLIVALLDSPSAPSWNYSYWWTYPLGTGFGDSYGADSLALDGDMLYVSRGARGVAAFDLSLGTKPVKEGTLAVPGSALGMDHSGDWLYAAAGYGHGLNIVDTSDPALLDLVVTQWVQGTPKDVKVRGGRAYVAAGVGVWVMDVSLVGALPPVIDADLTSLYAGPGAVVVTGMPGAVTGGTPSLSAHLTNLKTGLPYDVNLDQYGGFSETVPASPGDEITLTVQDSATPPQSVTVSLGTVPAGAAVSFAPITGTSATDSRQVLFAGNYLLVNATDRVVLLDPADIAAPDPSYRIASGTIHDIAVSGDLVLVGDDGLTIMRIDASVSPPVLVWVSSLPASSFSGMGTYYANKVAVYGQTAYIAYGGLLWPVDISVPSAPRVFGSVNNGGYAVTDLVVWRNELLASTTNPGYPLIVALLDDPSAPSWNYSYWWTYPQNTGFGDSYGADSLALDGDMLYVSRGARGVAAFDLSLGTKPVKEGTLAVPGSALGIDHSGDWLYAAAGYGYGLNIVDTSDPALLDLVVTQWVQGTPKDVKVRGGRAYVAAGGGVWVLDILQAMPPVIDATRAKVDVALGSAILTGLPGSVTSGTPSLSAHLTNLKTGLPYDVDLDQYGGFSETVPASPGDEISLTVEDGVSPVRSVTVSLGKVPSGHLISFVPIAGTSSTDSRQIVPAGNYLLLNATDRILVLDPSNINAPSPPCWVSSGVIHDMAVSGNLVLVGDNGFTILRIDDSVTPPALVLVSSLPASSFTGMGTYYPNMVTVYGQTAYVAYGGYLWPVNISVPEAPSVLASVNNGGYAVTDLVVWRNELLASTTNPGYPLIVALLDNPSAPSWNYSYWWTYPQNTGFGDSYGADQLLLVGDTLYASRKNKGIAIFNLANNMSPYDALRPPTLASKLALDGLTQGICNSSKLSGLNSLYVARGGRGMSEINVSVLASPECFVTQYFPYDSHDAFVRQFDSGGGQIKAYLYVAAGSGVYVVDLVDP